MEMVDKSHPNEQLQWENKMGNMNFDWESSNVCSWGRYLKPWRRLSVSELAVARNFC